MEIKAMWAVKILEENGATFPNPEDKTILARLSPQTTLEDCVQMGGTKYNTQLWVLPARQDIVVFEDITVLFDGKEHHPSCCFHEFDEGTIWPSDLQIMLTDKSQMESMRTSVAS